MKKIFAFVAAALMFVGCNSTKNYVVEGTIEGLTGQVAVMDANGEMILDLATVTDGSFELEVENDGNGAQFAMFAINNSPIAPIFLDGEKIKVEGNIYSSVIISGTPANDALNEFNAASQEFSASLPEDFDPEAEPAPEVIENISKFLKENFEKNKDNLFGAFMVVTGNVPAETPEELLGYIESLGKEGQNLPQIQEMKSYYEQQIAAEAAPIELDEVEE